MDYEDFEIGDRVGRFYGDIIEKAIILFKSRFIKLYGEKYIVCKDCQKLIRHS